MDVSNTFDLSTSLSAAKVIVYSAGILKASGGSHSSNKRCYVHIRRGKTENSVTKTKSKISFPDKSEQAIAKSPPCTDDAEMLIHLYKTCHIRYNMAKCRHTFSVYKVKIQSSVTEQWNYINCCLAMKCVNGRPVM